MAVLKGESSKDGDLTMSEPVFPVLHLDQLRVAVLRLVEQPADSGSEWAGEVLGEVMQAAPGVSMDLQAYLATANDADFQVDRTLLDAALAGLPKDEADLYIDAIILAANAEIDEGFDWEDIEELQNRATGQGLGKAREQDHSGMSPA